MEKTVAQIISDAEKATGAEFSGRSGELIAKYFSYLLEYNKNVNLISRKSEAEVLTTGLIESFTLFEIVKQFEGRFLDVGSGGGIPGMIIAIMLPEVKFVLLDSIKKKTVFLESAVEKLELKNVSVMNKRLEEMPSTEKFDSVFSRGVGSFEILREHYFKHLKDQGGIFILTGEDNLKLFRKYETIKNPFLPGRIIAVLEK
jgi:16S rRNA (guanine527-N7)-methyltransferase